MPFFGDTFINSIVGVLGFVVGAAALFKFNPNSRANLKEDIELLKSIEKGSHDYEIISKHISKRINRIYAKELKINHLMVLLSIVMFGVFFYIYFSPNINSRNENFGFLLTFIGFMGFLFAYLSIDHIEIINTKVEDNKSIK